LKLKFFHLRTQHRFRRSKSMLECTGKQRLTMCHIFFRELFDIPTEIMEGIQAKESATTFE